MRTLVMVSVFGGVLAVSPATAQTFNSGSTGADGALDLATMNCETGPYAPLYGQSGCSVQLPESGILNYTTISVPTGKILNFKKNRGNTPVVLLAQGDVDVQGVISVDAVPYGPDGRPDNSSPGPGGFAGGYPTGTTGLGPGGGTSTAQYGRWVGPLSLIPIVGGSGGTVTGAGGAIVIASSGRISIPAGGSSDKISAKPSCYYASGTGSGGAVRLVANQITMAGSIGTVTSCSNGTYYVGNNPGIVRLEAPSGNISYTGNCNPPPILSTINPTITAPAVPGLRIVSVAGYLVPDSAGNRKDAADLVLPKQMADPINVLVEATNIPVGSPVTVSFGTSNTGTSTAGTLAGSLVSSTATIPVSGLNRDQLAYLYVQVLFAPPALRAASVYVPESSRVAQVRMTQSPGAKPRFAFLRGDGAEVPLDKVPPTLQAWVSDSYLK